MASTINQIANIRLHYRSPRQVSQSHEHNKHYYADSGEGPFRIIFEVCRRGEYSTEKSLRKGKMVEYSTMRGACH
jgi:hypothetical protein